MRLLLDTCTFLWAALDDPKLSADARELLLDPESERLVSAATAWEIAIKVGRGHLALPEPPKRWVPLGRRRLAANPLPIDEESALQVAQLPPLHRDPFDRILVAQAIVHGCVLLTPDPDVQAYPVRVAW
jgi:PIN domain nuclease of toxin-antitoxin system